MPTDNVTLCMSCGTKLRPRQRRCPYCGRLRTERWPKNTPDSHKPSVSTAVDSAIATSQTRRSRLPVWIEFLSGVLGIHGLGYVLAGEWKRAIPWLIFSVFWEITRGIVLVTTIGFGCLCLGPLGLVISIVASVGLHRLLKKAELAV